MNFLKPLKLSALALTLCAVSVAQSHPHLRLAYQLTPLLSQDHVTAVQVSWQMDHMNTALVRENIDLNQNGLLDADELAAFAKTNQDLMGGFNYFLTIEDGLLKTPVAFEVQGFSARDAGRGFQGGVYLEFTAVLKNATKLTSLQMQMQDPTWFIGFEPRMGRVLAAASDCDSSFTREKRLTPSQGEQEVQRIHIQCASGSPAQPNAHVSPTTELNNGDNT